MNDFMTNCVGALMGVKALAPLLEKAAHTNKDSPVGWSRAAVINITSFLGSIEKNSNGGFYSYRASKCALNMVTKTLSIEFEPKGVLCAMLHPGWVKTDMTVESAPMTVAESVSGMVHVMSEMGERDQGAFKNFRGETLPW